MPAPVSNLTSTLVEKSLNYVPFPAEGPRDTPLQFDFTSHVSYYVNLAVYQAQARQRTVQGAFFDNSQSTAPLLVVMDGSGQALQIPAGAQAVLPLFAPNPVGLTATCTAGGNNVQIHLLNFPVTSCVWFPLQAANAINGSGALKTADTVLDGIVTNGALANRTFGVGSADQNVPNFEGTTPFSSILTAAANAAILTGNPGYFLQDMTIGVDPLSATAAAGITTISFVDSSDGTIFETSVWLPATSATPTVPTAPLTLPVPPLWFYDNKVANSTLSVTLSHALTAGGLYVNFKYGTTAFLRT